MRRNLLIVALLLLVCGASPIAWTLLDWPPPSLVLKYGIPPYCAPTGRTMEVEGIEFVEIGPGCFRMGSEYLERGSDRVGRICEPPGFPYPKMTDETPVHWVEFENGFWISKCEITNEQYERLGTLSGRSEFSFGNRHPVVRVSWVDAKAYCAWLSERSGLPVRLPSEAMWECACRGGSEAEFCIGDDENRLEEVAWHRENHSGGTHEVGTSQANAFGLFDLHGNVWEFCEDTYHRSYVGAPGDGGAWTEDGEEWEGTPLRVYRGGGWLSPAVLCRSAIRAWADESYRGDNIGFRPAFTLTSDQEHLVDPE